MPVKCAVDNCKNFVKFKFPKNKNLRKQWLEAIRRPNYIPWFHSGICKDHFFPHQINNDSKEGGRNFVRERLIKEAIPCIFEWTIPSVNDMKNKKISRQESIIVQREPVYHIEEVLVKEDYLLDESESYRHDNSSNLLLINKNSKHKKSISSDDVKESKKEIIITEDCPRDEYKKCTENIKSIDEDTQNILNEHGYSVLCIGNHIKQQEQILCRYSIDQFKANPRGLHYFTGLESYDKFMAIYNTLGKTISQLTYHYNRDPQEEISAENKLFLTFWKLRKNCNDFELSQHFCISEVAIKILLKKMLVFIASQWSILDIWPTNDFIKSYIPKDYVSPTFSETVDLEESYNRKKYINLSSLRVHVEKNIQGFKILSDRLDPTYVPLISQITGICMTLCIFKELIKK